jgi:hypothetical protein
MDLLEAKIAMKYLGSLDTSDARKELFNILSS